MYVENGCEKRKEMRAAGDTWNSNKVEEEAKANGQKNIYESVFTENTRYSHSYVSHTYTTKSRTSNTDNIVTNFELFITSMAE